MVERGTKIAVGFGLALVIGSILLIIIGDVANYFGSLFSPSTSSGIGTSLITDGEIILALMAVTVIAIVGVWIYGELNRNSGGGF